MRNLLTFQKYLNGDYSNYDASLSHQMGEFVVDVLNNIYDDSDENKMVRRVLIMTCFNSVHISNDMVYMFRQGNPSGCALTTIINCLANMFLIRYAFLKLTPFQLDLFHVYVRAKFFGDDNLVSLHDSVAKFITMPSYQTLMRSIGITYTSATKAEIIKDHYNRDELTFLTDAVYKCESLNKTYLGKYVARLDMETIKEIARWSKSDPNNMQDQLNRFNMTLYYLVNYDKEMFEQFRNKFAKYCDYLSSSGYSIKRSQLFSFDYAVSMQYPDHFKRDDYLKQNYGSTVLLLNHYGSNCEVENLSTNCEESGSLHFLPLSQQAGNVLRGENEAQTNERDIRRGKKRMRKRGFRPQNGGFMAQISSDFDEHSIECFCSFSHVGGCKCNYCKYYNCLQPSQIDMDIFQILCQYTPSGIDITEYYENETNFGDIIDDLLFSSGTNASYCLMRHLNMVEESPDRVPINIDRLISELLMTAQNGESNWCGYCDKWIDTDIRQHKWDVHNVCWDIICQTDEHPENIEKTEKVTTFFDDGEIHVAEDSDKLVIYNSMPNVDLPMFLSRPVIVAVYNWTAAQTMGTAFTPIVFPDIFYTVAGGALQEKLNKISFFRPDIEITVRVNGTLFHYGRLVFCWIPQATILQATYKKYFNSFSNRWFQISANTQQETTIVVPFTHVKNRMTIGKNDVDLFTLFPYVSVPLSSVSGVASTITYTIFARMVNPNVQGYAYTNDYTAQVGEENEKKIGKVANAFYKARDFAGSLHFLPGIGMYMNSVALGAKLFGDVSRYLGMSVPINIQTHTPMQVRQPLLNYAIDSPLTVNMGQEALALITKDYAYVNDTEEAASILHFMQRPALLYTGQITSLNLVGAVLWQTYVTPLAYLVSDYVTPVNLVSGYVATPVAFMSKYAQFWRGGFRFHISFIASKFHSCRVRLVYIPYISSTAAIVLPTDDQAVNLINLVFDITTETEYSFTVPFMQPTEWLNNNIAVTSATRGNSTNGYLLLQVVNVLTGGEPVVNPIYFQVFVSAANDFQLGLPTTANVPTVGAWQAQSGGLASCKEFPSMSMDCLMKIPYPVIGGIENGYVSNRTHQSFEITGVKQLTNMVTQLLYSLFNPTEDPASQAGVTLNLASNLNLQADKRYYNMCLTMMSVFRYYRGSYRVIVFPRTGVDVDLSARLVYQATTDMITLIGGQNYFLNTTANYVGNSVHMQPFPTVSRCPLDITVPYYSIVNCKPISIGAGLGTDAYVSMTVSIVGHDYTVAGGSPYMVALGGGDDFILGFQLGIPYNTTTLT